VHENALVDNILMIVGCINMMVYVGFRYEFALGFNAQPNI